MNYQLHTGNCLDILPTLEPQSIDAVIADIPYGTTACAWDSVIPFAPMWECIKHAIKPRGALVLFGSQPFTSALVMSNPTDYRYMWTWIKPQGTNPFCASFMPLKNTEDVCVFGRLGVYNPQLRSGKPYRSFYSHNATVGEVYGKGQSKHKDNPLGLLQPITTLSFPTESGLHPTQKPVALMAYLIKTYTNPGETVLDFTMGSGSTGVACAETGRNFVGIELDPHYFAVASERIEAAYRKAQGMPRLGKPTDTDDLPLFAD